MGALASAMDEGGFDPGEITVQLFLRTSKVREALAKTPEEQRGGDRSDDQSNQAGDHHDDAHLNL